MNTLSRNRAARPSVLQLVFQARAFAHVRARLVLLKVGLVIDRGLQHYLFRDRLLAQVSRRDLNREATDDETVEFAASEHLIGLDEIDRFLAAVDPDHHGLAVALFQRLDDG